MRTTFVIDRENQAVLGDIPTPWLIEEGGGRAYSEKGSPRIWMAADYPGTVIPEGATVKNVTIRQRDVFSPFGMDCVCVRDDDGGFADHPLLEAECSNAKCSGTGEVRRCSMSDCVCFTLTHGQCAHCGARAIVRFA